ncbi:phosphoglycerate kinase, partial [Listeria monocytogenes]
LTLTCQRKSGKITNDNRIVAALPTIEYILEQNGKAILFSHLGKVKTEEDKEGKSLRPVAARLSELLGKEVKFVPTTRGPELCSSSSLLRQCITPSFQHPPSICPNKPLR